MQIVPWQLGKGLDAAPSPALPEMFLEASPLLSPELFQNSQGNCTSAASDLPIVPPVESL